MTLPLPVLDNRTFLQLVSESTAQIARLAPAWTDYNLSDPGITLIELFAWLSEQNLYRTDRITPELSRAFLRLVGVTPCPATVAESVVLLATATTTAVDLPDRIQLADAAGDVAFETREAVTVSPAVLTQLLAGSAPLADVTVANTQPFDGSKDDTAGSFQPFGDEPTAGAALYLGFDRSLGAAGAEVSLHVWTRTPAADATTRLALRREWAAERAAAERDCPPGQAAMLPDWRCHYAVRTAWEFYTATGDWKPLPKVEDETRALSLTGFVRFALPADHVAGGPGPLWFIRCRIVKGRFECAPWLDRVGINAVTGEHAASIAAPEALGRSRGHGGERYVTAFSPVVAGSTRLTLTLGADQDQRWTEALDWDLVGAHDRRYVLEPGSGRITGGNGLRGAVWAAAWQILLDYRVGGGPSGNSPAGQLTTLARSAWNAARRPGFAAIAGEISVTQPYPALGGAEAETLAAAEARAIADLARPRTTVTLGDFSTLACATPGVPVGRAKAIANHHPVLPCFDAPGSITVVVVPNCPGPAPRPGADFLRAVASYLHPRRPITTEVHVVAPDYVTVVVSATLQAAADADTAGLPGLAQQTLDAFFNPLRGGPDGTGWPIGRAVYRTEIMAILARLPGVLSLTGLTLAGDGAAPRCDNLTICAGDLVRSGQHMITVAITGTTIFRRSKERECP